MGMKILQLKVDKGVYSTDQPIDITVDEWKNLLCDDHIFYKDCIDMVKEWYYQQNHQATTKAILVKKGLKSNPYNGIVSGLGKRIIKSLNRFEIQNTTKTEKSYFIIFFEGWYEKAPECSGYFVWKVRNELVQALEDLNLVDKSFKDYMSDDTESFTEGGKRFVYTTKYERNPMCRDKAIKIHGKKCQICGFDFCKTYGDLGKNYIEVHHVKPLSEFQKEIMINPKSDLICVCANCHRMLHKRIPVLQPLELQEIITKNKN